MDIRRAALRLSMVEDMANLLLATRGTTPTICDYRIDSDDIYNFNETGFTMGLTATAGVITRAEYYGRPSVL
ncbi:hypothetical protein N7466_001424 [Penicillium verhagenii]|uniref:uncharacterized protein n=1 Tax=Penicillium verhagenii TaxID=1562060 RepID=UPI0025450308|nr:uncharacterized protein N7466_001424 [Penicillium verhagenii]KAJ5938290.1 hypothetical protein N7466_001424 [Penicillium verhagenii]